MKKVDQNICIRIDRDEVQISRAKKLLKENIHTLDSDSNLFSLMGNKVRLSILLLLLEEKKLCVCDLAEILEMKIPAVSQHLRKLKDGRVIDFKREGTVLYYFVKDTSIERVSNIIKQTAEL